MKKHIYVILLALLGTGLNAQIKVYTGGNILVGATPSSTPTSFKMQVIGNSVFSATTGAITSSAYIRGLNGYSSATTPDYTWYNNDQVGVFHPNSNVLAFTTNGTERARFRSNGQFLMTALSATTTPDYSWKGDSLTGVYHPAAGVIGFATGGGEKMRITNSANGAIQFSGWTNVYLDWNNGDCCGTPALYPQADWYLQLGTPTKFIGDAYISHELYKTAPSLYSDVSIKNNINYTPDSLLFKLKQLKPTTYFLNASFFKNAPQNWVKKHSTTKQHGFIAQDLIKVFPELVEKDSTSGLLSVNYIGLIPVLVSSIQQQGAQIDSLRQALSVCCNAKGTGNRSIKQDTTNNGTGQRTLNNNQLTSNGDQIISAKLYQNNPNPFSQTTVVKCFVPQSSQSASLLIFDLNGSLKKTIAINNKGEVNTTINGRELVSGMYYYTLLIDGNEIDTKKMILTE